MQERVDVRDRAPDRREFRALAEFLPTIMWQAQPDGSIEFINAAYFAYTGLTPDNIGLQTLIGALHPDDVRGVTARWVEALQTDTIFDTEFRIRRADGVYRWFAVRATPLRNADGEVTFWFGTCVEADVRKRNEHIKDFLVQALSTFGDYENVLDACGRITRQATQTLAAFCFFDLVVEANSLQRVAWSHRDPQRLAAMSTCTNCPPFCGYELESQFAQTLREKHATLIQHRHGERNATTGGAAYKPDPGVADWLEISSLVSIPLIGREKTLGVLTFARAKAGDYFDEADVTALEGVGHCIGLALESVEIAERNRRVADSFQVAALPKALPNIPGFTFNAVYQAAKSDASVGGDWYDAFRVADGRIVLSIGDVMGSGLDAAVTMSAVRQSIRGAAQIYPDPVTILNAADRALRSDQPNRIVTAFVAVLDPLTLTLTYAGAGHPPPLLRARSGDITELSTSDLPLGLREQEQGFEEARTLSITEPSLFVFYTDGLTEATRNIFEGELRLRAAIEGEKIFETGDPAAMIRDAIIGRPASPATNADPVSGRPANLTGFAQDDVAVMTVRIDDVSRALTKTRGESIANAHWSFEVEDPQAAREVRRAVSASFRHYGAEEGDICNVELIFSELVGNVIRHAGGVAEAAIDFSAEYPVLHVLDRGPGFTLFAKLPNDVMSESGRGLFITKMFSREFSVVPRADRGSHARVVLNVRREGRTTAL